MNHYKTMWSLANLLGILGLFFFVFVELCSLRDKYKRATFTPEALTRLEIHIWMEKKHHFWSGCTHPDVRIIVVSHPDVYFRTRSIFNNIGEKKLHKTVLFPFNSEKLVYIYKKVMVTAVGYSRYKQ